jgi:hypothetical protein
MRNKQTMQSPTFAPASRGNKNNGTRRRKEDRCSDAAECARPDVCSDLRTHDDHACVPLGGLLHDHGRGQPWPPFDDEPSYILTRELHTLDELGGCQGIIGNVKDANRRMQQFSKATRRHPLAASSGAVLC